MIEKLYLETSVVSYYTSRPSNDIIILARQRITEHGGILLETNSSVSSHKLFLKKLEQVTMKLQKNDWM